MIPLNFKKKTILTVAIAMLLANFTAYASPLSDRLSNQKQQLKQTQDTYNEVMKQLNQTESSIQKMDNQMQDLMFQIEDSKKTINKTQADIKNTELDIKKSEEELHKEQELFNKRVRVMYMNGNVSYLNLLLGSKSMSDFIVRIDGISKVLEFDKKTMKQIKEKQAEVVNKKTVLVNENKRLESLQQANKGKLSELETKKASRENLIKQLQADKNKYSTQIAAYNSQIASTVSQMNRVASRGSIGGSSTSRGGNSTSKGGSGTSSGPSYSGDDSSSFGDSSIVEYAENFLGVPYVLGGNTPSGFDCSGFTKYVFAHFGINLERRASEQACQGTPVSRGDLQPGDLVFFGDPVYHVGIYIGGGSFIHAPVPGDVVKISSLRWMDYSMARRVR